MQRAKHAEDTIGTIEISEISPAAEQRILTTESVILGFLLGGSLVLYAIYQMAMGEHSHMSSIQETAWVALFLTAVVAFCPFKLPTPLAATHPRLAMFALSMLCGHVSLLFDSFAVVLLLTKVNLLPADSPRGGTHRFNSFAFKTVCAFNALTVGGAFYLGELWGLPYYISSGMDTPLAGLPLLAVVTPMCILTSALVATLTPVGIEPVELDRTQGRGAVEIGIFLLLLIVSHNVFLCMGALLFYSALSRRTAELLQKTSHELVEGGANAIGLILVALSLQQIPAVTDWFASNAQGPIIGALSALSSPFAGAMIAPATSPEEFYTNLSWIMLGAPMFVWSSLVAIMVFRDTLDYSDLPLPLQRIAPKRDGVLQEAVAYTALVIPMAALLGAMLYVGNSLNLFATLYRLLGG